MRDVAIADPLVEDLGPAMLALNPMQRRFVVGWIAARGKNAARVARAAGYSDLKEGAKVRAFEQLHNPKVQRALHEEAGRRLDGMAALAVAVLEQNLGSTDAKARQVAADSILDRTGYSRRTEQVHEIEDRRPARNYEQLIAAVSQKLKALNLQPALPAPVVDGEFEEAGGASSANIPAL